MINYFNFTRFKDRFLITNDLGRYAFLDAAELKSLASGSYEGPDHVKEMLEQRGFLTTDSDTRFLELNAGKMRNGKSYVFSPTSLHIFVVSTACNLACSYCQANGGATGHAVTMDEATATRAVDVALQSPARYLSFEFQGGEPLTNFPAIKRIVEHAEQRKGDKCITYSLVSNLTLLTDEMLEFLVRHNVGVSTSLDGPALVHNVNRPFANGSPSMNAVLAGVARVREAGLTVGAIQTTTRQSLPYAKEIVRTYQQAGFESIFVRPLTPLGAAGRNWDRIGYTAQEFASFYRQVLDEVIRVNKEGHALREGHASLFLAKMLHGLPANYMELRSPCGAAIGQVAYCPDGNVFTCDEGRMLYEMGDDAFRLGNVFEDDYPALMAHPACRATCVASVTESIPGCCDCVYQPYCGICPVVNYALEGDLLPKGPGRYRCEAYRGMLDAVFSLAYENDPETMTILEGWHV